MWRILTIELVVMVLFLVFRLVCVLQDASPGFMLCSPDNLCHTARIFDAQVVSCHWLQMLYKTEHKLA